MSNTKEITVGFTFMFLCYPLTEWGNWGFDRRKSDGLLSVGPMRFRIRRETATRAK